MSIRILVADGHKMFRQTLRIALEQEEGLRVVAEAGSGADIFARLSGALPDLLILDIGLPDRNGIDVARQLARDYPQLPVVILSGQKDRWLVDEAIKAGALAFVVKAAGVDELVLAIRSARAGKLFLSPDITASLMQDLLAPAAPGTPSVAVLGKREQEVLRLLAAGKTSPEIARALGISAATASAHRRNIKQKLQINSIAELTRYAIRAGLISAK